jgi:hypothetical protein
MADVISGLRSEAIGIQFCYALEVTTRPLKVSTHMSLHEMCSMRETRFSTSSAPDAPHIRRSCYSCGASWGFAGPGKPAK